MKMRAGIEVVAQEAEAGPATIAEKRGAGFPSESAITRTSSRRSRDAGREAVQPVEEVDHVHQRDDPEQRQRHAEPAGRS